ncbi:MAG: hypothetical protein QXG97_06715 [Nitrososphaerota archaeon]
MNEVFFQLSPLQGGKRSICEKYTGLAQPYKPRDEVIRIFSIRDWEVVIIKRFSHGCCGRCDASTRKSM